jgi:hypothetical protein
MDEGMQSGWAIIEDSLDPSDWFRTKPEDDEDALDKIGRMLDEESERKRERDENVGGYSFVSVAYLVYDNGSKVFFLRKSDKSIGSGVVRGHRFTQTEKTVPSLEYSIRIDGKPNSSWFNAEEVYSSKLDLIEAAFPDLG